MSEFDWKYQSLEGWENTSITLGKALNVWFDVPDSRQTLINNPDKERLEQFIGQLRESVQPDDVLLIYLGTHQLDNGDCLLAAKQRFTGKELATWLSNIPNQIVLIADVCYAGALDGSAEWPKNISRIYAARTDQKAVGFDLNARRGAIKDAFSPVRLIAQETLKHDIAESSLMGFQLLHVLASFQMGKRGQLSERVFVELLLKAQAELVAKAPKVRLPAFESANESDVVLVKADKQQKNLNALSELMNMGQDKISIEDGLFLVSSIYHPSMSTNRYKQKLDAMVKYLRPKLDGASTVEAKIGVLTDYLHNAERLTNVPTPFMEDFLFHNTLDTAKGRCSSFTAIYLILAERLGLPLTAACLPEHIFVRWQKLDGGINIETTESGKVTTDEHYRKVRPWTSTRLADAFYLKSLSPAQILATYLSPLGEILRMRGRFRLAEDLLELSTTYNPGDAEAWNHLGMVRASARRNDDARFAYQKAIAINPGFAAAWNNLGNISSTLDERLKNYQKAVELDPELGTAWMNLSYTWYAKKNYQMAWTCANRCIKLGMTLKPGYIQTLQEQLDK